MGYLSTWSCYATYQRHRREHPELHDEGSPDLLERLGEDRRASLRISTGEEEVRLEFPVFMILAKKAL